MKSLLVSIFSVFSLFVVACSVSQPQIATEAQEVVAGYSGIDQSAIDSSVRPQDDFHAYANGNWLKNTVMPAEHGRYGTFTQLNESAEANLRKIVETSIVKNSTLPETGAEDQAGSNLLKIGYLYQSYMDTASIERAGLNSIKQDLNSVTEITSRTELLKSFSRLMRLGYSVPFDAGVIPDFKDSSKYAFYFFQSGLGLPDRDYYLVKDNSRFTKALKDYEEYIVSLLGLAEEDQVSPASELSLLQRAQKIIELERNIATGHWPRTENRVPEKLYNPYPVAELPKLAAWPWTEMLEILGVSTIDFLVVAQPSHIEAFAQHVADTPLPVWQDYLRLRILSDAARYLPERYASTRFDFYGKKLSGLEQQKDRWRRGLSTVSSILGEPLGREYVAEHFPPEAKQKMLVMVNGLLEEFRIGIDDLAWMSQETKAEAQDKLSKITVKIGYPDQWRDFSALKVDAGDLIGNVQRSNQFDYDYEIAKLGGPIDKNEWGMNPHTVNAYYNPTMNEIVFPAGILQPPMFDLQADDAANYGAAGLVIGHEISHAFDDQGSSFDGDGNLRNWWTEADAIEFKKATDKLVEQYNAFEPVPGQTINGKLTLGENIGDLSGASVAIKAYQRSLKGKSAPVIDGLTGQQRFFFGYARTWRTKYRDEILSQMLVSDPHSPHRQRVNGVVPNMPEFYEAFGVKEGDQHFLPEAERVKIW